MAKKKNLPVEEEIVKADVGATPGLNEGATPGDAPFLKRALKIASYVALIALVLFSMVFVRAYSSQLRFFNEGEQAFKALNYKDAMTGYEWTIRMYTPFSSRVALSCERLWEIGEALERSGQLQWALLSYSGLKSSLYSIKALYSPYQNWILKAEARIDLLEKVVRQREIEAALAASASTGVKGP